MARVSAVPEAPEVYCERCGTRTVKHVVSLPCGGKDYFCDCGYPLVHIRGGKTYIAATAGMLGAVSRRRGK